VVACFRIATVTHYIEVVGSRRVPIEYDSNVLMLKHPPTISGESVVQLPLNVPKFEAEFLKFCPAV